MELDRSGHMPNCKRDHQWFDQWCRRAGMAPVRKYEDSDGDVLIADSGVPIKTEDGDRILTAYAIDRGGAQIGCYEKYDPIEFFGMSVEAGREFRVKEALKFARQKKAEFLAHGIFGRQ